MVNGITITISLLALLLLIGTFLTMHIRMNYSKVKDSKSTLLGEIFKIVSPGSDTVLIDLGAGDFRVPFYFSSQGIKSEGVELSPLHVLSAKMRRYLMYRKLRGCKINLADMYQTELSKYSIIYLNHSPEILSNLKETLLKSSEPSRIFSLNNELKYLDLYKKHKLSDGSKLLEYRR